MFSRFTGKALNAIMIAQEEARRLRHACVGPEHILLGILGVPDNVVLHKMGFSNRQLRWLRGMIEAKMAYDDAGSDLGNIPFTEQARQLLCNIRQDAHGRGHNHVTVQDLFLTWVCDCAARSDPLMV